MNETVTKVAAVQAAPVFLDIDGSVEKACSLILEAGRNGAKLVGFPESFIPAFPFWIFKAGPMGKAADLYMRLRANAMQQGDRHMAKIVSAAREAAIHVCLSVTELDGGSLYLTQFWFDPSGNLVGKHRKLKPTGPERCIWGEGDGSMMPIVKAPFGNLGGLQCWEHMVPLISAAMSAMNEQIHIAAWPGGAFVRGGPYEAILNQREQALGPANRDVNPLLPHEIASRYYAMATQTFVLMSTHVVAQDAIDAMSIAVDPAEFRIGGGGAQIIAPDGIAIGEPLPHDEEGLVYGDIPLDLIAAAKYMCDTGGHYSVPDVLSLNFNRERKTPMRATATEGGGFGMSFEDLQCRKE